MKRWILGACLVGLLTLSACSKNSEKTNPAENENAVVTEKTTELVQEKTAEPVDEKTADSAKEEAANSPKEAVKTAQNPVKFEIQFKNLPAGEVVQDVKTPDGLYVHESIIDGAVVIGSARIHSLPNDRTSISRAILAWPGEPYNVKLENDDAMSAKWTHPTWKITYLTGHNEDTHAHSDWLIQTDDGDYRVYFEMSVDATDEYLEKATQWIHDAEFAKR